MHGVASSQMTLRSWETHSNRWPVGRRTRGPDQPVSETERTCPSESDSAIPSVPSCQPDTIRSSCQGHPTRRGPIFPIGTRAAGRTADRDHRLGTYPKAGIRSAVPPDGEELSPSVGCQPLWRRGLSRTHLGFATGIRFRAWRKNKSRIISLALMSRQTPPTSL